MTWQAIADETGRSKNFLCKRFRSGSTYVPRRKTFICTNCGSPTNSSRKLCNASACQLIYHRELASENWTYYQYGLTSNEVHRMLAEQDFTCLLCPAEITFANRHVDHDHKTGKFRGLLCGKCNRGLGFFDDDPAKLRAAAEYLERTQCV